VDSSLNSRRFCLGVTYIGARYCGWQNQGVDSGSKPSIQSVFEAVLRAITGEKNNVIASGRTDAGVSALEQVVHFDSSAVHLTSEMLIPAMNSNLPPDIRILWAKEVEGTFHAQRSAIKKQYSYYYLTGPCALPEWRYRTTWIRHSLDVGRMHVAAHQLVGEHDFLAFQGRKAASSKSTVRTIFEADVTSLGAPSILGESVGRSGHELIRVRLVGSGFLKQMVRSIAGTLREIGENRRSPESIDELIRSKNRSEVGVTAIASGLWLERVWYP
jgi:tRNA pseudouridine38-40 synthase